MNMLRTRSVTIFTGVTGTYCMRERQFYPLPGNLRSCKDMMEGTKIHSLAYLCTNWWFTFMLATLLQAEVTYINSQCDGDKQNQEH